MVRSEGGVVPMSVVHFNEYPCSLSSKVLDDYFVVPLEKGPMTETVVLFCKHAVLNVLAFHLVNVYLTYIIVPSQGCASSKLAIWVYIHYTNYSFHSILYFPNN